MKIAGIVLILVGIAAVVYGGFSFTSHKKALDMGPIQVEKTEHHTVPVPPILGIACIVAGGALVYFGAQKSR